MDGFKWEPLVDVGGTAGFVSSALASAGFNVSVSVSI